MRRSNKEHFVLEARLLASPDIEKQINKRFFIGWRMSNIVTKYAKNQLQKLHEDKRYRDALDLYKNTKGDAKKTAGEELKSIVASYRISEYDLQHYIIKQQHKYKKFIDSPMAQKIASDVSKGVSKILYSTGKRLHFKKLNAFTSLEGKSNATGLRLIEDDGWHIEWLGLVAPIIVRKKDLVLQQALENNDISYCRIVRKTFRGGYRYFIQIVFQGKPPSKHKGRRSPNKRVGADIGTSTIAATNGSKCVLKQLASGIEKFNQEIEELSTKLEHLRRVGNPNNFNENGTIKRGKKLEWNNSNNYKRTLRHLKNAYRKRSAFILESHNKLANEILALGNEICTEQMNFKALAKRAEKTEISEKTGKYESKKRFGKSIESRAPGLFTSILARKLKYRNKELHKVNTTSFKASKYNHSTNTYTKKELSDRHAEIDGKPIQRDLYSAFLLMNSNPQLTKTDRELCIKSYPKFKKAHDKCTKEIKKAGQQVPSSFGI